MSWRGFKKGLRELANPPHLQGLNERERQQRRQRSWRHSELFIFFQAAEPKQQDQQDQRPDEH